MDIKNYLGLIAKIRFFFLKGIYTVGFINNKITETKEEGRVLRILRYVAKSPFVSFLNSRNFDYALNIAAAVTVFGATGIFGFSVSAYSMGLIPSAIIVGSVVASVAMNGNELYKHKKMLKIHSVLTGMLNKVEKNNELISTLSEDQKAILKNVLPDGIKSLNKPDVPKPRKPLTALGVSTFRGVFSGSTLVAIAGSMVAMNPWAIGMTTAGWISSMIGITDKEKRLYNVRMDFKDKADGAKQQLGCYTITSAISEYKRISAESAVLKAIKQGHSIEECKDIYNQVFEKTIPQIRRETRFDAIKARANCSVIMLKKGFSSVETAKLYEVPEINNHAVVKNEKTSYEPPSISHSIKHDKEKKYPKGFEGNVVKGSYTEKLKENPKKPDSIGHGI